MDLQVLLVMDMINDEVNNSMVVDLVNDPLVSVLWILGSEFVKEYDEMVALLMGL